MLMTDTHAAQLLEEITAELSQRGAEAGGQDDWHPFATRLRQHFPTLLTELTALYGDRADFRQFLRALIASALAAWQARPADLRALDAARETEPDWFQSHRMLGGVCYVDLHGHNLRGIAAQIPYFKELGITYLHLMPLFRCPDGNSDGGYAVSSYRAVHPALGTIEDLRALAHALRQEGISLVLDFIFNHTSNEHDWARRCLAGDPAYQDFYFLFPDRTIPDQFDATLREIFPDQHPGGFSQLADGRWVWSTFNTFQWDLNYGNPAVFKAMAEEMLAIANLGTEVLRMDAVAFVWKRLGTTCENLPEAHTVIRAFSALVRIAAPGLLFKSEAIVHPDDVVKYISPQECQLSYNPLQMALLWNTLATREVNLLQQALEQRHTLPPGTAWVNYVRSHDDIGWTFSDEDAAQFGIQGFDHRQFLNRFFVNRFPGSFARGVPFQDNPATGDCRICGTSASLAGLEQGDPLAVARILLLYSVVLSSGGIPLLYLGDEVGVRNDPSYLQDPSKAADSRWVHRPPYDAPGHAARYDRATPAGQIFTGMQHMIRIRQSHPVFGGNALTGFRSGNPHVLGYTRGSGSTAVLVLANFSERTQDISARTLSAQTALMRDLITGNLLPTRAGVSLAPYQVVWLESPA